MECTKIGGAEILASLNIQISFIWVEWNSSFIGVIWGFKRKQRKNMEKQETNQAAMDTNFQGK